MVSIAGISEDLTGALKSRDSLTTETLRGLKTRIQNEQIAKQKDLSEDDLSALIRSEVKRRKEAAAAFTEGGRQELADKELAEVQVLAKYLPPEMSEDDLGKIIDEAIKDNRFTAAQFGQAMSALKAKVGNQADGATLAKLLKEKLQKS